MTLRSLFNTRNRKPHLRDGVSSYKPPSARGGMMTNSDELIDCEDDILTDSELRGMIREIVTLEIAIFRRWL